MYIRTSVTTLCLSALLFTTNAIAQNWPTVSTPEWEALLAAGQQEGQLVILGDAALSGEFVERFEQDTGIEILFVSGPSREVRTRFAREVETDAPTVDALLSGSGALPLVAAGKIAAIAPILVLPEVTNGENWRQGMLPYFDAAGQYLPVPSNYITGLVLVNTDMVNPATITTWDDLLRPEFKGKITTQFTPTFGGGRSLASYIVQEKGEAFFAELYNGQEIKQTTEYRQVTEDVARGISAVGLSALSRDVVHFQSQGIENLEVLHMSDVAGYTVGGFSVLSIAANAPNPNASAVFANWYLSQHGQEAFSAALKVPSERVDVVDGDWPEYIIPQEGRDYLNTYNEDWRAENRPQLHDAVKRILAQ